MFEVKREDVFIKHEEVLPHSSSRKKISSSTIPSSVKTIWNNAFANCYNLTDIYFKGNAIYTESNAFPEKSKRNGTLTIHCSANCSDRNYRYYKDEYTYNHPCFITLYNLIDKIYGRYKDDTWHPIVENRISQIKLTIREPLPADSSEKICVSEIILLNGWK